MSSGDLSWTVKHKIIQIKYNDGRKMLLKVWLSKKLLSSHMVVFLKCLNKLGKRESARERERERERNHDVISECMLSSATFEVPTIQCKSPTKPANY